MYLSENHCGFPEAGKGEGAGAAVVYASGYSEVGTAEGKAFEKELVDAAKALDMVVIAPTVQAISISVMIFSALHSLGIIKGKRATSALYLRAVSSVLI